MIWVRDFIDLNDGDIISLSGGAVPNLYKVDRHNIYETTHSDTFIRIVDHLPDLKRGDLVAFGYGPDTQYRNEGVFIFDGTDIISLDMSEHGYGFLPKQFTAEEFPIGYFSELAYDERYYVTEQQMKDHVMPPNANYTLHLID